MGSYGIWPFIIWFFLLRIKFSRFIYLIECINASFYARIASVGILRGYATFCVSVHPLMDICVMNSIKYCKHLCACILGYLFSVLWGICLEVELPRSYGNSVFNFWGTTKLFPQWLHRFTCPPVIYEGSNLWISSSTQVTFHFLSHSHPSDVKYCLTMVLVCITLMTNDVELSFLCLLAICVSSFFHLWW